MELPERSLILLAGLPSSSSSSSLQHALAVQYLDLFLAVWLSWLLHFRPVEVVF